MEAALAIARAGLRADPVVLPPPALRRYVGFAKLSPAALAAIARVVDQDDDFRERVATAVDAEVVGRGGWLWLARPPGWADELAAIDAAGAARAAEEREARDERLAAKRLAAAQAATERAEADAAERRSEIAALRAELSGERARRAEAAARLEELEAAIATLTEARATAVRSLKEAEARLVNRSAELKAVKTRVRQLEADALQRRDVAPADRGHERGRIVPDPDARAGDVRSDQPTMDRGRLVGELERAAQGAASLADGLAALAELLAARPPTAAAPAAPADAVPAPGAAPAEADQPARSVGRKPIALPGGMLDDSVAAAEHLLRTPAAVLVVDGYNVTMNGWPELGAADQRRRLVGVLAELAARTSTRVELVFDGADVGGDPVAVPAPARQLVHVRFSPPGVEADDVVLDLVEQLPASAPVVVASSDNRVRDGARRRGANLLHSRQLLDVLGIGSS